MLVIMANWTVMCGLCYGLFCGGSSFTEWLGVVSCWLEAAHLALISPFLTPYMLVLEFRPTLDYLPSLVTFLLLFNLVLQYLVITCWLLCLHTCLYSQDFPCMQLLLQPAPASLSQPRAHAAPLPNINPSIGVNISWKRAVKSAVMSSLSVDYPVIIMALFKS